LEGIQERASALFVGNDTVAMLVLLVSGPRAYSWDKWRCYSYEKQVRLPASSIIHYGGLGNPMIDVISFYTVDVVNTAPPAK
jgi:hypothetical protein